MKIAGKLLSGKNAVIVTRSGQRFPAQRFKDWRECIFAQIEQQIGRTPEPVTVPVKATIRYWPGDRIRRDAPGIIDALWHCLERAGIVADDALFQAIDYRQEALDRANPRATVTIEAL